MTVKSRKVLLFKSVMDINPLDCLDVRCPRLDHPFHYECHSEGLRLNKLKRVIDNNKENIPPCWIREFSIRELALATLFFECVEDTDYSFYAFKLHHFNDLLTEYLLNSNITWWMLQHMTFQYDSMRNRTEPLFLLSWIDAQMSLFPFIKDKLLLKTSFNLQKIEQQLIWYGVPSVEVWQEWRSGDRPRALCKHPKPALHALPCQHPQRSGCKEKEQRRRRHVSVVSRPAHSLYRKPSCQKRPGEVGRETVWQDSPGSARIHCRHPHSSRLPPGIFVRLRCRLQGTLPAYPHSVRQHWEGSQKRCQSRSMLPAIGIRIRWFVLWTPFASVWVNRSSLFDLPLRWPDRPRFKPPI